jgi:aryl-alcohol dehydrogenase-like predicted oxidoreductase
VVLATKLYIATSDWPNSDGLSALHIRRACEDSPRRLQTDHIDLYQFHHINRATFAAAVADLRPLADSTAEEAGFQATPSSARTAARDRHPPITCTAPVI